MNKKNFVVPEFKAPRQLPTTELQAQPFINSRPQFLYPIDD
jgi:hypothetical protein